MDHSRTTTLKTVFSAVTIAAGEDDYSDIIPISKLAGNASLQIVVTGDGTARIEWVGSNTRSAAVTAFIKPNNANDIVTAFTKTSGPGGDGKHIYPFSVSLVDRIAIKVTETSTTDAIVITAILAIQ
jgi:hypothetical protein